MSNKIIEEQRRAREEEIKLKQMRQGLIEVEHKDEAAVIIPKTPNTLGTSSFDNIIHHAIEVDIATHFIYNNIRRKVVNKSI